MQRAQLLALSMWYIEHVTWSLQISFSSLLKCGRNYIICLHKGNGLLGLLLPNFQILRPGSFSEFSFCKNENCHIRKWKTLENLKIQIKRETVIYRDKSTWSCEVQISVLPLTVNVKWVSHLAISILTWNTGIILSLSIMKRNNTL